MNPLKTALIAAGVVVAGASSPAWADGDQPGKAGDKSAAMPTPQIQEINKNPSAWLDKKVHLNGEVDRVVSPQAFVLDGDGIFNDRILVISEKATSPDTTGDQAGTASPTFKEDDEVALSGTVRRMSVVEIEREYGFDLDPELEVEFEGSMPVVISRFNDVKKTSS